ncbi:amidohydrolase family protein [Nonomuraea sp. NPDC050536]|uniref:amidohydrolase family protein n=1 Tax=Nonomuraea sp. NPDC050536 TaxID=3364366 RepID=UPI0037C73B2B
MQPDCTIVARFAASWACWWCRGCGNLPRYYPRQLVHFMNTYGCGKVMFGTNWPQLPHDRALAQVAELKLTDEARADFLGGAARHVFRIGHP